MQNNIIKPIELAYGKALSFKDKLKIKFLGAFSKSAKSPNLTKFCISLFVMILLGCISYTCIIVMYSDIIWPSWLSFLDYISYRPYYGTLIIIICGILIFWLRRIAIRSTRSILLVILTAIVSAVALGPMLLIWLLYIMFYCIVAAGEKVAMASMKATIAVCEIFGGYQGPVYYDPKLHIYHDGKGHVLIPR